MVDYEYGSSFQYYFINENETFVVHYREFSSPGAVKTPPPFALRLTTAHSPPPKGHMSLPNPRLRYDTLLYHLSFVADGAVAENEGVILVI